MNNVESVLELVKGYNECCLTIDSALGYADDANQRLASGDEDEKNIYRLEGVLRELRLELTLALSEAIMGECG